MRRILGGLAAATLLFACSSDDSSTDGSATGSASGSSSGSATGSSAGSSTGSNTGSASGSATGGGAPTGSASGTATGKGTEACGDMGLLCRIDQICVAFHATAGPMTTTTYECFEDPCVPQDLACSCAGKICADQFNVELCNVDMNAVLNCDNGAQCAAPDTPIATPSGERAISELQVGDLVMSQHRGAVVAVPIARVSRTAVRDHAVVEVQLSNGRLIHMSGPHPDALGRRFDALDVGAELGPARVMSIATVPYQHAYTYDILPASDSGSYVAAGALIGSTLSAER